MDWSTQRMVPIFSFQEAGRLHCDRIAAEYPDALFHIGSVLQTLHEGLNSIGPLPLFDKRDKSTLLAALTTRSFKSLSCAADLAVRGYYVQAITLVRAVHENRWICWAVDQNSSAAEAVWNQKWPREMSFLQIAKDIDAWLTANGLAAAEEELYRGLYGNLSEIAHPRGIGVRMEFDSTGMRLETGPSWDSDYAAFVLGHILIAAKQIRVLLLMLPMDQASLKGWIESSESVCEAAHDYIQQEIARIKALGNMT